MATLIIAAALVGSSTGSSAESALDASVRAACQSWERIGFQIGMSLVYDRGADGCQLVGQPGTPSVDGTLTVYPDRSTSLVCREAHGFGGGATQYLNGRTCLPPDVQPGETPTPESSGATALPTSSTGRNPSAGPTDAGLPPFNFGLLGGGHQDVYLNADGTARINGVLHVFKAGDTITSNAFTQGVIHLPGEAAFSLKPNSRFQIGGSCRGRPAAGTLMDGVLHMLETTPVEGAAEFSLQSGGHMACIGVRGTEFVLQTAGAQASVTVLSGRIMVSDDHGGVSVDVDAGQQLSFVNGEPTAALVRPIASQVERWWEHEVSPLEFFTVSGAGLILVNVAVLGFFWRRGRLRRVEGSMSGVH